MFRCVPLELWAPIGGPIDDGHIVRLLKFIFHLFGIIAVIVVGVGGGVGAGITIAEVLRHLCWSNNYSEYPVPTCVINTNIL